MHELKIGETDVLGFLKPDTLFGAIIYLVVFFIVAMLLSRGLRAAVHAAMARKGHIDLTTVSFLQQFGSAMIWVIVLILYAHLIPVLRSMGTALLAGASIASVVIGLAAQSTLGNLVAGVSITIYRPFRLGDTLQVAAPTGTEIGTVELISLGYTTLRTADGRYVVLPNSLAASQVTINLKTAAPPSPLSIMISVARDTDIDAARDAAIAIGNETAGAESAVVCFLKKIESASAVLELQVSHFDPAKRDSLRAKILARLARRFGELGLDTKGADRPSFS